MIYRLSNSMAWNFDAYLTSIIWSSTHHSAHCSKRKKRLRYFYLRLSGLTLLQITFLFAALTLSRFSSFCLLSLWQCVSNWRNFIYRMVYLWWWKFNLIRCQLNSKNHVNYSHTYESTLITQLIQFTTTNTIRYTMYDMPYYTYAERVCIRTEYNDFPPEFLRLNAKRKL